MKKLLMCLLLSCLLLSACSGKEENPGVKKKPPVPPREAVFIGNNPEDQVKNVVMRYNQLLVYGYENFDMNPIQEVAVIRLAEKAYYHMSALGEGGARMVSRMTKIDFEQVLFPQPGKAAVKTREFWDFAYHDIHSGTKKEEKKDFVYLVNYRLEWQNGRWMLVDIVANDGPAASSPAAPAAR